MGWLHYGKKPHACKTPRWLFKRVHVGAQWLCDECHSVWTWSRNPVVGAPIAHTWQKSPGPPPEPIWFKELSR